MQLLAGLGQRFDHSGFAGSSEAYDHDSVSDHDGLHKLDDFGQKLLGLLVVFDFELVLDGSLQTAVVDIGNFHSREEIGNDAHEQRQVVL